MKRALIIRGGAMKGAYLVGVIAEFHRQGITADYFDAIYSNSVGVFEQVFYAANQPYFMENTWREYVHGKQLIDFFNF
jgi:predicted patatin/cPLA2 family phospholipase